MATARRLPSGNFRVRVYNRSSKKYESFTAPTKREAERLALSFQEQMEHESAPLTMTLGEAMDAYIASKDNVLSPSTINEYRRQRKRDLQGLIDIPLGKLTNATIQKEINKEAETHAPKTVRNIRGFLSVVLNTYRPDFKLNITVPAPKEADLYVPSDNDVKTLIQEVKGKPIELPILLAAFGSMRRSEICALVDTDIIKNTIYVNKAMVKNKSGDGWVVKQPKSRSGYRSIDMPDFVIQMCKGIKGRIVPDWTPTGLTKAFIRTLDKIGLPKFRFHDLRHYQASVLHALGMPDLYIMRRGGWGSRAVLDRIYKHEMKSKQEEVSAVAIKHFENLLK